MIYQQNPSAVLSAGQLREYMEEGEAAIAALPPPSTPALIYGYGVYGRDIFHALREGGACIEGFVDAHKAGQIASETGLPIMHPQDIRDTHVLVQSINNPLFDLATINDDLRKRCRLLLNPLQALWWAKTELLWSAHPKHYAAHFDVIVEVAERMHSDSQSLYAGIWHDRLTGTFSSLNSASPNSYFPDDIPGIPENLLLVDCGAYDGDVARDALRLGRELHGLIAFEPDSDNYARLVKWISENRQHLGPTVALPAAVGNSNSILCFASGLNTSSHLSDAGGTRVPCLRLDDVLVNHPVNYIKLDVEGAEADTLRGAANTLRQQRPALAVSIYHKPDDLFQLPALIDEIAPGYELRLRAHALAGIDMVLYATVPI